MTDEHNPYEPPKAPLTKAETTTQPTKIEGPEGLGGWLILPLIGLIVTPIASLAAFFQVAAVMEPDNWQSMTAPGGEAYHPLWMPFFLFEEIYNIIYIVLSIYLLILVFKKSAKAPLLFIIFYALNLAMQAIDTGIYVIIAQTYPDLIDSDTYKDLIRAAIACLIWIPYFRRSVRVKNTFVH